MHAHHPLTLGLLTALLATGACQSEPKAKPRNEGAPKLTRPPAPPLGAVATTRIRERAIQKVEAMARSEYAGVRSNAVEAAAAAPARLPGVIEQGLTDPKPGVRSVAALAVGRANMTDLADAVTPLLADPTPHVRASAIYALTRCGRPVDPTPLSTMLLDDSSPWVRRHAAFILGELGDLSALPLLRSAARDTFPAASAEQVKNFQLQIAEAMVKLGDEPSRQVLRAALYPSRPEELETAALAVQIIGQVKDRGAIDQLIYLAEYKDRAGQLYPAEVRLGIAAALAAMGHNQGGYIADEFAANPNAALRAQAAFVYGEIGDGASWTRLDTMMDDSSETVQAAAAAAILRSR